MQLHPFGGLSQPAHIVFGQSNRLELRDVGKIGGRIMDHRRVRPHRHAHRHRTDEACREEKPDQRRTPRRPPCPPIEEQCDNRDHQRAHCHRHRLVQVAEAFQLADPVNPRKRHTGERHNRSADCQQEREP